MWEVFVDFVGVMFVFLVCSTYVNHQLLLLVFGKLFNK